MANEKPTKHTENELWRNICKGLMLINEDYARRIYVLERELEMTKHQLEIAENHILNTPTTETASEGGLMSDWR